MQPYKFDHIVLAHRLLFTP